MGPFVDLGSYPHPEKTCPVDEPNPGRESSTTYSRSHHSTKCNGWSRRFLEPEWLVLFRSIIRPFTEEELLRAEFEYEQLDYREIKDRKPKKVVCIFDPMIVGVADNIRPDIRYKKPSLEEIAQHKRLKEQGRRDRYKARILVPPGGTGYLPREYLRYPAVHRFGSRGKGPIAMDYYEFPSFFTYGWSTGDVLFSVCQPEDYRYIKYGTWPFPGYEWKKVQSRFKNRLGKITGVVYIPAIAPGNKGQNPPFPGPQERPHFAEHMYGGVPSPEAFASAIARIISPPSISKQGSMASCRSGRIGQALNTLYRHRGRLYPIQACNCGGMLKYSDHAEMVCDECQAVYESLDHSEYMNSAFVDDEDEDEYDLPDFYAEEDHKKKVRVNQGQNAIWKGESIEWHRQGIKLKTLARKINSRDIMRKRIGRVCSEIQCNIQQLKNSTVLQRKFLTTWLKTYNEQITKTELSCKNGLFRKQITDIDFNILLYQ